LGANQEVCLPSVDARLGLSVQEPMALDTALQKQIRRIGEIVEQLESTADPNVRAMAKELLESLMSLHGAALERILELTSEAGEAGETVIRQLGRDELVSSLLLLYSLHPEDLNTRVAGALEKARIYLASHSASADLVSIGEDGTVTLRLEVKSTGCGSSVASVKAYLEAAMHDAAPDAQYIVVEDAGGSLTQSGFVSLAQLESGQAMASLSGARPQRSGD
jgi:Fe-S cluster biogenesis protein NfuA